MRTEARAMGRDGGAREYADVFELRDVPAYRWFYDQGIFVWKALYRGSYAPWHTVPAPTIENPRAVRQLYRLNAAKAVCAELAGLVWGEACDIRVSSGGKGGSDPLDGFVHSVLRENGFHENLQQLIEQGLALGGAAVKVWAEASAQTKSEEFNRERLEIGEGRRAAVCQSPSSLSTLNSDLSTLNIRLGYGMADQFVPLGWDGARVREGVFVSRATRGGRCYTRLEWHRRHGEFCVVENELFRADAGGRRDVLGERVPLAELYPGLEERVAVRTEDSLFTYWRTPVANNLDDHSPLGMSVYGNALETLRALDICYDSFISEFRLGKKRIIVPARCVRAVADPATGQLRRYFDPRDEVYEAFAGDDKEELRVQDNSTQLRVEEHIGALNAFLNVLCLQLGFSANTFSFDARGGLKTATEVVSENSKTYKTVKTVQNQLMPALEHVVKNIIDVAILYGATWEGVPVEELAAGGYEVKVVFDDGVTQDRQTNLREGMLLVEAGLLSRLTFLTDRKYGQGLTVEEARAELERIREERKDGEPGRRLSGGGEPPPEAE